MEVKALVAITEKGVFVSFEKYLPLKGIRGKFVSKAIINQLIENNYQAQFPVLFVNPSIMATLKNKGYNVFQFNFNIELKKGFQYLKEAILKQI